MPDSKEEIEALFDKCHSSWVAGDLEKFVSCYTEPALIVFRNKKLSANTRKELANSLRPLRDRLSEERISHYAPFRIKIEMWGSKFALIKIPAVARPLANSPSVELTDVYFIVQKIGGVWNICVSVLNVD